MSFIVYIMSESCFQRVVGEGVCEEMIVVHLPSIFHTAYHTAG